MSNAQSPVSTVLLFANEDEAWRVVLLNHLSGLTREGQITLWDVSQIAVGTNRVAAIEQHLKRASVILLLVSAACLASHDHEIEQVLHRQKTGDVVVIPILLYPVDWYNTRLAPLQPLPGSFEPITMWQNSEAAFVEVIAGIRKVLPEALHLATRAPSSALPPIWNVPYARNPVFTGREEILRRIETQLQKGQAAALSQAQAISGLGGIGKTQIV
jgi:TIR domain